MPLTPGSRLGPYEITSQIGAGGMGEVYRATDGNLKRSVAIKVLPASLATDSDRLARFQREAEVLAALNHPNIAAIYGLEKTPEMTALVMELVEGDDLSAHIARGAIPPAESLPIARQIADALEAAHEHGIIHRDLKPANVKVRADGAVKVLDFGLAKVTESGGGSGEERAERTETAMVTSPAMTQAGMILGTAAYMAPEQARGRPVDRRADVWAFGVVLFEMLTGRRAFPGDDVTDTIVSVVSKEPDWGALPEATPAALRRLLARCLKKDPKARLRDIGEARVQIDEIIGGAPDDAVRPSMSAPTPAAPKGHAIPWAIAGLALIAVVVMGVQSSRGAPPAPLQMHVSLPFGTGPGLYGVYAPGIAISSDGATIVYVGRTKDGTGLFRRQLDQAEPGFIRGTDNGTAPFLSPKADWVGFWTGDGHLKKVAIDGGVPVTLCDSDDFRGASWGADGFIVYTPNIQEGLWRVSEKGGTPPERLTTRDTAKHEKTHRMPDVLPDGKGILFMIGTTEVDSWDDGTIAVLPPGGGPPKILINGGMMPRYVAPGYLVYARGGDLLAAPFDVDRLEVTGPAMSITSDAAMISSTGAAEAAFSPFALAYLPGRASLSPLNLIETDRSGVPRKLSERKETFNMARWLPDHVRLLVSVDTGNTSAWMFGTNRNSTSRVTFKNDLTGLAWNRATSRVMYTGVGKIVSAPLDANGREDIIYQDAGFLAGLDVSPDGKFMLFGKLTGTIYQLWMLSAATGKAEPWLPSRFSQSEPRFSSDGRWVTYTSTESDLTQVFARAANGAGPTVPVSAGFGLNPVWSRDGKELFYADRKDVWVASVRGGTTDRLEIDKPRRLFTMPPLSAFMDVAPDDQHFLLVQSEPLAVPAAIAYVTGWLDRIKTKSPAGR